MYNSIASKEEGHEMRDLSIKTIEEMAIEHDEKAYWWFKAWKKSGEQEHDFYWNAWQEHEIKCYAMLDFIFLALHNHIVDRNFRYG